MSYNPNAIEGLPIPRDPNTIEGELAVNRSVVNDTDNYNTLLNEAASHWGQDPQALEGYMDRIAFHETGGTRDPRQEQIAYETDEYGNKTRKEARGRGLFQFETGAGYGGETAINRLHEHYNRMGLDIPDWAVTGEEGFDASTLSPQQQKMLFLSNARRHPTASFKGVTEENLGRPL